MSKHPIGPLHDDFLDAVTYGTGRNWQHFKDRYNIMHKIWVQADGTKTPVKELATTHIHYIIRMLKKGKLKRIVKQENKPRADAWADEWIRIMEAELDKRNNDLIKAVKAKDITDIFPAMKK